MQTGRAGCWATREFDYQVRNGTFCFTNWSAFAGEFQKEFMPPKAEDEVIGMLATDRYFQGKRTVGEYLDEVFIMLESGHSSGFQWNPEELKMAEGPANIAIPGSVYSSGIW